jgi:hypothetical protein
MEYIAFDAHKHYTLASVARPDGQLVREQRIAHERGALQQFLERCERGSPVAVETVGNWYWIVDEIEAAGCIPRLVHARKAKLMMGEINKTDKIDVRGLNQLQRTGTLPTVWIPPGELRDQRDLPRTRMVLVRQRTQLKNRIHATLAKYALHDLEVSDPGWLRRRLLQTGLDRVLHELVALLPPGSRAASRGRVGARSGSRRRACVVSPGPASAPSARSPTALQIIAEASQLKAELEEALPRLAPASQLEARQLIGRLEETIATVGAALTITAPDTAAGSNRSLQEPSQG